MGAASTLRLAKRRLLASLPAAKQLHTGDTLVPSSPSRLGVAGMRGRLVEIFGASSSAALTSTLGIVRDAQQEGETAVWITPPESCFFPPDAAEAGVDLFALTVVRVPAKSFARAADKLVRSGAFGLVVLDLEQATKADLCRSALLGDAALSRLLGLAQKHDVAVIFLTRQGPAASHLGSLVSLRGEARRVRLRTDQYEVEVRVVKDKRRAPGWRHAEPCRGPAGLR